MAKVLFREARRKSMIIGLVATLIGRMELHLLALTCIAAIDFSLPKGFIILQRTSVRMLLFVLGRHCKIQFDILDCRQATMDRVSHTGNAPVLAMTDACDGEAA